MEAGTVWVVARPAVANDTDGEVSNEYLTNGTSLKGLTGSDGTVDSQYYFALGAFIAALDNKVMMKGTQEKPGDAESKKKADAPSPSKRVKKEMNAAERTKKPSYNNAPPPTQQPEGGAGSAKPKCLRCFGGGGGGYHEKQPEQCRAGYKHVKLEPGYHEGKLSSNKWWEVENAAIRMYNLKNCFKGSD
ncbi:hypothetical protein CYMTET_49877 [Cymbomonas tetramitiformis]|uniref:Uncharacterized protein n=1 Tax=Cymbomonas tetramitiformis TaxID=36881 RepID=A0AAE0BQH6_9CHLO|nr:hypothetical protein CYMTET_49877 [Cymbomonas tetramitiformis]